MVSACAVSCHVDDAPPLADGSVGQNRSMEEDLLSMICADGLVTSRSSLTRLLEHHTLASRIYFPGECTKRLCRETARPGRKVRSGDASCLVTLYLEIENSMHRGRCVELVAIEYTYTCGIKEEIFVLQNEVCR